MARLLSFAVMAMVVAIFCGEALAACGVGEHTLDSGFCGTCEAGYTYFNGEACEPCAVNTYQLTASDRACTACPTDTTTEGATGSTLCYGDIYVDAALGDNANDGSAAGAGSAVADIDQAFVLYDDAQYSGMRNRIHVAAGIYLAEGTSYFSIQDNLYISIVGAGSDTTYIRTSSSNTLTLGTVVLEGISLAYKASDLLVGYSLVAIAGTVTATDVEFVQAVLVQGATIDFNNVKFDWYVDPSSLFTTAASYTGGDVTINGVTVQEIDVPDGVCTDSEGCGDSRRSAPVERRATGFTVPFFLLQSRAVTITDLVVVETLGRVVETAETCDLIINGVSLSGVTITAGNVESLFTLAGDTAAIDNLSIASATLRSTSLVAASGSVSLTNTELSDLIGFVVVPFLCEEDSSLSISDSTFSGIETTGSLIGHVDDTADVSSLTLTDVTINEDSSMSSVADVMANDVTIVSLGLESVVLTSHALEIKAGTAASSLSSKALYNIRGLSFSSLTLSQGSGSLITIIGHEINGSNADTTLFLVGVQVSLPTPPSGSSYVDGLLEIENVDGSGSYICGNGDDQVSTTDGGCAVVNPQGAGGVLKVTESTVSLGNLQMFAVDSSSDGWAVNVVGSTLTQSSGSSITRRESPFSDSARASTSAAVTVSTGAAAGVATIVMGQCLSSPDVSLDCAAATGSDTCAVSYLDEESCVGCGAGTYLDWSLADPLNATCSTCSGTLYAGSVGDDVGRCISCGSDSSPNSDHTDCVEDSSVTEETTLAAAQGAELPVTEIVSSIGIICIIVGIATACWFKYSKKKRATAVEALEAQLMAISATQGGDSHLPPLPGHKPLAPINGKTPFLKPAAGAPRSPAILSGQTAAELEEVGLPEETSSQAGSRPTSMQGGRSGKFEDAY